MEIKTKFNRVTNTVKSSSSSKKNEYQSGVKLDLGKLQEMDTLENEFSK